MKQLRPKGGYAKLRLRLLIVGARSDGAVLAVQKAEQGKRVPLLEARADF